MKATRTEHTITLEMPVEMAVRIWDVIQRSDSRDDADALALDAAYQSLNKVLTIDEQCMFDQKGGE